MRFVWVLLLLAGGAACSRPAQPTGLDVPKTGTYAGPVSDVKGPGGQGVATLRLDSTGDVVSGTWVLDLSNGAYRRDGLLSGQASGGHIRLVLRPAQPQDCTFQVDGVTAPGDRMSGTWTATSCSVPYGGSIELIRQ
jgi:hypothetical protein